MIVKQFEHTTSQVRVRKMLLSKPEAVIYIRLDMPSARSFNDWATQIKYKIPRVERAIRGEKLLFTVEKFDRLVTLRRLIRETRLSTVKIIHDNEIIDEDDFIINADDPAALERMMAVLDKARPTMRLDQPYAPKNRTKKDLRRKRLFILVSNNFEQLNDETIAIAEVSNRGEERDVICRFKFMPATSIKDTATALVAVGYNRADYLACRRGFQGEMPALETPVSVEIKDFTPENILTKPTRTKQMNVPGQLRLL
ncbi:MAG: hypothetical protein CMH30_09265 [Micavibrio sp.]|nr:hypothetical protein [Micavibrio sp.]